MGHWYTNSSTEHTQEFEPGLTDENLEVPDEAGKDDWSEFDYHDDDWADRDFELVIVWGSVRVEVMCVWWWCVCD